MSRAKSHPQVRDCGAADDHGSGSACQQVRSTRPRDLLMVSLSRFYADSSNMAQVLPYIMCNSAVSLRLIDWFVTNYAKEHNVVIRRGTRGHFNVYLSYRAQLKAYSKQLFDPFRRRDRIIFHYSADHSVETTIGQLNFFRWMLENKVLGYVLERAEDIEGDMMQAAAAATSPTTDHAKHARGAHAHPTTQAASASRVVQPAMTRRAKSASGMHRPVHVCSPQVAPASSKAMPPGRSCAQASSPLRSAGARAGKAAQPACAPSSRTSCKANCSMTRITGTRMIDFD